MPRHCRIPQFFSGYPLPGRGGEGKAPINRIVPGLNFMKFLVENGITARETIAIFESVICAVH
jgi:hypothetical protein